jgi:hypothetical protein
MKTTCLSETWVDFQRITRRTLHNHRCENPKSYICWQRLRWLTVLALVNDSSTALIEREMTRLYCGILVVSRKRISRYVATERLILGNHLDTIHGFHAYENWKLCTLRNQTVASELTHGFRDNTFMKSSNGNPLRRWSLFGFLVVIKKEVLSNTTRYPSGGGVEYLHRVPASRRRRRKRKSRIWDSKIWSGVL